MRPVVRRGPSRPSPRLAGATLVLLLAAGCASGDDGGLAVDDVAELHDEVGTGVADAGGDGAGTGDAEPEPDASAPDGPVADGAAVGDGEVGEPGSDTDGTGDDSSAAGVPDDDGDHGDDGAAGPPRPPLPDGWRWHGVDGLQVGVPEAFVATDLGDGRPHATLTAMATLPDALFHAVVVRPLTVFDDLSGTEVAVATIADYERWLWAEHTFDPVWAETGPPPIAYVDGATTSGHEVWRVDRGDPGGDVATDQWLVQLADGVAVVERDVYVEDAAGPFGDVPAATYRDTIWVDPATWVGPTPLHDGRWVAELTDDAAFSIRGAGVVEAGLTVHEAERLTGQVFELQDVEMFDGYCFHAFPPEVSTVQFMVEDEVPDEGPVRGGEIVRASAYGRENPVRGVGGVGPGDTADDVRAVHGDRLVERPHEYVLGGLYLDLFGTGDDERFGTRWEVADDGVVDAMHAGFGDAIQYVEGCA